MSADPIAPPRRGVDPGIVLWTVTALGWAFFLAMEFVPHGHLTHAAHALGALGAATLPWPVVVAAFTGGWLVMIAAMMLPTTVPMARMFTVVSERQERRGPVRVSFFGAYLLIWLVFAAVALAGAIALGELVGRWDWSAARPGLVLAAALALAGAFQFSSLKQRCLTACREPAAFLFQHYRRGIGGAWSVGLRHGLSCLGCCWALMLVMFATGAADLAWMLGLTAVMVAEKMTRWGHRLVTPVGVALLLAAAVLAIGDIVPGPSEAPGHVHVHSR